MPLVSGYAREPAAGCLAGGGEMGALMRAFDWGSTPVGPVDTWPQSLRTALGILLSSVYPMYIAWGPEYIQFYNDAYRPILGATKHPALGQSTRHCFREIWDFIGPMFDRVMATGEATWREDQLLCLERYGYREECYFTFSYSAVRDESGASGGVFVTVIETTRRVLGERRLRSLRELAAGAADVTTAQDACARAGAVLASNPNDLPFALIYLLDERERQAVLAGAAGVAPASAWAPRSLALDDPGAAWPLASAAAGRAGAVVEGLDRRGHPLPSPWPEPPHSALVLPFTRPGTDHPAGFLVAGISPRRALDEDYRDFLRLVAGHIGTGLANARAHEEERRRAEALAELDRAKTTFFSNVSHEFRTPLTLLLGPIEDLLAPSGPGVPPAARELLTVAHRNALRLLKLVNTLLDFSRIEAGRVQACYEATDLAALTADLASVFRAAVERAGLRLLVDCPSLPEPVYVDREMWEKIVLNLLSNALKFTFAGEIRVSLRRREEAVVLDVSDTGVGIPEAELPHLFERFRRVEGVQGRTHEGTGIGLALVQELTRLHGGSATAASTPGRGSTFTVTIPLGRAHLPPEQVGRVRTLASTALGAVPFVEEALRWLPDDGETPVARPDPAPPAGAADGARVLLVDDNADMREYVRRLLAGRYVVESAADGEAALAAARASPPDLVLADVMMPRMDGFTLLRELRADPATRGVPVILLSARAGEESRVEGLEAGADDYLVKPFSARELLARVGAHLELARARREMAAREEALRGEARAAHGSLERVLAGIQDALIMVDREWRCTFLNERAATLLGRRREELLGRLLWDSFPEEPGGPFHAAVERAVAAEVPGVFEFQGPASGRWFEIRVYPFADGATLFAADVTDRRRAVEALRTADRQKDAFLAMLGHELRTPLAPVANALYLLKTLAPSEPLVERQRAVLERQLEHMTRLIDDLLDVARITQGKIELRRRPLDLREVIAEVVEACRSVVQERRHELCLSLPDEPLPMEADPARLHQVFSNLLQNAAKYTEPGGKITLQAAVEADQVVARLRDTGDGMTPELLARAFELFAQAEQSLDRTRGGLGIGLTMARRLVEMHGGTITGASEGPGRGSEFTVRLPMASLAASLRPRVSGETRPVPPGAGRRILLIEDNLDAAETLRELLQVWGHECAAAHSGREGLDLSRTFQPEIVILDIGLPELDGYQVAKRIRAEPGLEGVPLIAVTGYGHPEDRRRAREAGFDHHLTKPVRPDALLRLLQSLPGR